MIFSVSNVGGLSILDRILVLIQEKISTNI